MSYPQELIRKSMPGCSPESLVWNDDIEFLLIDLFCGAGGVTTGFERAQLPSLGVDAQGALVALTRICKTIACVNHDAVAIAAHAANHPHVLHFTEDIKTLNLTLLIAHLQRMRVLYPKAKVILWASLECTNFSVAKGGKSREADSRSLADHMPRYILALKPDYFMVENVREFMGWGPMIPATDMVHKFEGKLAPVSKLVYDRKKKKFTPHWIPENRTKGKDFQRWIAQISALGYQYDHRLLNAADFGAYTSRLRYFAIFAANGLPICWPEATHARKDRKATRQATLFETLKPWQPVRDVLDFSEEGYSIFDRHLNTSLPARFRKQLKESTFKRVYAGCLKHIAEGETAFLSKCYSGDPDSKNIRTDRPAGTLTTTDSHALIEPAFLKTYGDTNAVIPCNIDLSSPKGSNDLSPQNHLYLVQERFLQHYYGNGHTNTLDMPCATLRTKDSAALIQTERFIDQQYGNSLPVSVNQPVGTLTANPKQCLVEAEGFLTNPGWFRATSALADPGPTLIGRQDKAPLSLIQLNKRPEASLSRYPHLACTAEGQLVILLFDTDSETVIKLKKFMALHGIIDIKMRMLSIPELKRIQGFGTEYILKGKKSDQKKHIGNSVEPRIPKALAETIAQQLRHFRN